MPIYSGIGIGVGGSGFSLGEPHNLFGATSGDALASQPTVSPALSKENAETLRDSYAASNPTWLPTYDANPRLNIRLIYNVGGDTILLHQVRQGSTWVDNSSVVGVQGVAGGGVTFSGLSPYEIVMIGAAPNLTPIHSGIRRTGTSGEGDLEIDPRVIIQRDSMQIGFAGVLSGFGALIKGRSFVTGRTFVTPFQYYDVATGSERSTDLQIAASQPLVSQPDHTQQMSNTGSFVMSPQNDEVIWDITLRCPPDGVLESFRLRATVQGQTEPFYYFPDKMGWDSGEGIDIIGDGEGLHSIDLEASPLLLLGDSSIVIEYAASAGALLGDGTTPYFRVDVSQVQLKELARVEDQITESERSKLTSITSTGSGSIITEAERTKLSGVEAGAQVNVQSNWDETSSSDLSFIQNKPTIPVARTDEEITDLIGVTIVAGMGMTKVVDDANNTVTLNVTNGSGGGTPPPATADTIYYGLSDSNNPATVPIVSLTTESDPTNPDTISTGLATQGQYFILLVPQNDDIVSIFDTILNQDVTSIFTATDNVRVIASAPYKSYVIGQLNAGVNETYVINFGS